MTIYVRCERCHALVDREDAVSIQRLMVYGRDWIETGRTYWCEGCDSRLYAAARRDRDGNDFRLREGRDGRDDEGR